MFVLAHLAGGYILGRAWNLTFRRSKVNVWLAAFGGMVPDLIDKPLSFLELWHGGRTVAHSAVFLVALFALTKLHRGFLPLALGVATHLVLDDPSTFLASLAWPLMGWEFTPNETLTLDGFHRHLAKPRATYGEIAGAGVLAAVAAQHVLSVWWRRHVASTRFGQTMGAATILAKMDQGKPVSSNAD